MTGKNTIGFQEFNQGTRTFRTFNPLTNLENPTVFTEATAQEVDLAVSLAHQAFDSYQKVDALDKVKFLQQISKNILDLGEDLIDMYCNESGLGFKRALAERARTLWQIELFTNVLTQGDWVNASIDMAIPDRLPQPKPDLRKMLIPIGPVVVFGASNFPLAYSTAGGDTISALASGCPVIVKAHPMHSGTSQLVATAIQRAALSSGMPEGVFSHLHSNSFQVGTQLVKHPQVKSVGFTGSTKGGRALFDIANQREEPIPVFAEMGSTNPVVLLPCRLSQDNTLAATLANSITVDSGQFCTNPGLILAIEGDDLDSFISKLSNEVETKTAQVMLHPQILKNYTSNKTQLRQQEGVISETSLTDSSSVAQPQIVSVDGSQFLVNNKLHLEVFGPFSIIIKCKDQAQLTQIISQLEGQLTGSIMAEKDELNQFSDVIQALQNRVGRLIYNGVPTGVEVDKSMHHGGPYPATSNSHFTAVGNDAILRWTRPVSYQNWPDQILPIALQNDNPLNILRNLNGAWSRQKI